MTEHEWLNCADPTPMLNSLKNTLNSRKLLLFAVACCRRIWPILTDTPSRQLVERAEDQADSKQSFKGRALEPLWLEIPDGSAIRAAMLAASECRFWLAEQPSSAPVLAQPSPNPIATNRDLYEARMVSYFGPDIVKELSQQHQSCQSTSADDVAFADLAAAKRAADSAAEHAATAAARAVTNSKNLVQYRRAIRSERASQAALVRDIFARPLRPNVARNPVHACLPDNILKMAQSIYDERDFSRLSELAQALEKIAFENIALLDHCRTPGPHVLGCWALDLILGK